MTGNLSSIYQTLISLYAHTRDDDMVTVMVMMVMVVVMTEIHTHAYMRIHDNTR
jgi:hypothetical protein